jgi:hypothetical protein
MKTRQEFASSYNYPQLGWDTGRCTRCHELTEFLRDGSSVCCGASEIPCDVPGRD